MSSIKKGFFYLITFFFVLLLLEVCAYTVTIFLQEKGIFYDPPKIQPDEYREYLNKRDEVVGWPAPSQFKTDYKSPYDKSGSRFIPAFPDVDKYPSCVSIYGESFTYGGEVEHEDAWSNILSKLLNCRVSNYGVGGYGTDQAFLRFHKNINDKSQIVILGYVSENILRNVNQYRPLLYYQGENEGRFGLKPRFIIDNDGQLKLIPLPKLSYEEFLQMVNFPEKYLRYEYFIPGGESGILKRNFPYTLNVLVAMLKNFHIKAKIKDVPWYGSFYEIGHPSNALLITFSIINEFCLEVQRLHKKAFVLIIPTGLDLVYYNKNKKWPYENLIKMLEKNKIEFIDAGPEIIKYLKNRNPCELFYNCSAHFNVEGEEVSAEIVYAYLKEKRIFVQK